MMCLFLLCCHFIIGPFGQFMHGWAMIRKTKKKLKTIQRKTWGLSVGNDSITRNYLMRTARVGLVYNLHMHLHTLKNLKSSEQPLSAALCFGHTVKCLQLKFISFNPMLYIYRYIVSLEVDSLFSTLYHWDSLSYELPWASAR